MPLQFYNLLQQLNNTPDLLKIWTAGITEEDLHNNEGPNTWSTFDILGHLVHGEKTDWIPRLKIILYSTDKNFEPFDRFAQEMESVGKSMVELIQAFSELRKQNLETLKDLEKDIMVGKELVGFHPEFGPVTLAQLLNTWVVHDLNHIAQIARVLAFQRKNETGPWKQYLRILNN
ncbi:MAG: hypothetical protein ACI9YL_000957 [Luteibaculaceae bacterium]|jgi:hypothetical protein